MSNLINFITDKNGGLEHLSQLKTVSADIHVYGPFWPYKNQPELLTKHHFVVDVKTMQVKMTNFGKTGSEVCFNGKTGEVEIIHSNGDIERDCPREKMKSYAGSDPWTALETAYFISYASMMYLLEPILFTLEGVKTKELEPWSEDGETWRRLEVQFPNDITTHNPIQTYYFDALTGQQRRMDYVVEVNGMSDVAHYTSENHLFNGISVPTRRRVLQRNADLNLGDHSFAGILLDLTGVSFEF